VAAKIQKSSDWDEIWFPSRLWCCKLISIVSRQIVSGLRFQWKLISRSILKWGIGWSWWNLHPHAWILIWGSFGDFCVCIQTQSNLVIIIILIPLFSSASILSGTFLGNRTADPFETWHKNRSSLKVVHLVFKIFKMTADMLKNYKNHKMIIAGYSPNRNWWNLIGTTSISSGTR
jgi:hypothetical protein